MILAVLLLPGPVCVAAAAEVLHVVSGLDATLVYDVITEEGTILESVQPAASGILSFTTSSRGQIQVIPVGEGDVVPPDRIADLVVLETGDHWLRLSWTAVGDDGTQGRSAGYEISWSADSLRLGPRGSKDRNPPSPSESGAVETHTLRDLPSGFSGYVAVRARDEVGLWGELSNVVAFRTEGSSSGGDDPGDDEEPPSEVLMPPPVRPSARYESGRMHLEWRSSPDPDVVAYRVFRRDDASSSSRPLSFWADDTTYVDDDVIEGQGYFYRVAGVDSLLNESLPTAEIWVRALTGVPPALRFARVYPNPIRTQAVLRFDIPEIGPGHSGGVRVELDYFDVAGHRVGRIFEGNLLPGTREILWNPPRSGPRSIVPGLYVCVLRMPGHTATTKVAIVP